MMFWKKKFIHNIATDKRNFDQNLVDNYYGLNAADRKSYAHYAYNTLASGSIKEFFKEELHKIRIENQQKSDATVSVPDTGSTSSEWSSINPIATQKIKPSKQLEKRTNSSRDESVLIHIQINFYDAWIKELRKTPGDKNSPKRIGVEVHFADTETKAFCETGLGTYCDLYFRRKPGHHPAFEITPATFVNEVRVKSISQDKPGSGSGSVRDANNVNSTTLIHGCSYTRGKKVYYCRYIED